MLDITPGSSQIAPSRRPTRLDSFSFFQESLEVENKKKLVAEEEEVALVHAASAKSLQEECQSELNQALPSLHGTESLKICFFLIETSRLKIVSIGTSLNELVHTQ